MRRIASVCTGAFLLAASGLLDARRATIHWDYCQQLARTYVSFDPCRDRSGLISDEQVYTSGGVTASIDLAFD
ncbi:MAG: DJ-1/PfpI family protein [Gammaproteobacteria bacterium]